MHHSKHSSFSLARERERERERERDNKQKDRHRERGSQRHKLLSVWREKGRAGGFFNDKIWERCRRCRLRLLPNTEGGGIGG